MLNFFCRMYLCTGLQVHSLGCCLVGHCLSDVKKRTWTTVTSRRGCFLYRTSRRCGRGHLKTNNFDIQFHWNMTIEKQPRLVVTLPASIEFDSLFSLFLNHQKTGYLFNTTFIFAGCHSSWAAETPGKYERDKKYLSYTFPKSNLPITKLTDESLVTPTLDWFLIGIFMGAAWRLSMAPLTLLTFDVIKSCRPQVDPTMWSISVHIEDMNLIIWVIKLFNRFWWF